MGSINEDLFRFQAVLVQAGMNFEDYVKDNYIKKWISDEIVAAMSIRTSMVTAIHNYLVDEGLLNLERVQLSPVTDPLAHDVEHVPFVPYKSVPYHATHSMIYSKFLACFNPKIKGIFVDSPNIRLELEDPLMRQRGRYLIDFSQIDIEVKRNSGIDFETYKSNPDKVKKILQDDSEKAFDFFERMIIAATTAIAEKNEDDLKLLGVAIEVPKQPFPRIKLDDMNNKYGKARPEAKAGEDIPSQFFWVTGLMRENYDLIYPYLLPDGNKRSIDDFSSDQIYNYDICAKSIIRKTGKHSPALEILSGAIREWLYEPIIERLLDNKIIPEKPIFKDGIITNMKVLGGYGPFLAAVHAKDENGKPLFPDTMGGGIGVERTLYSILRGGGIVEKIDDITCFGKNPDTFPMFLF